MIVVILLIALIGIVILLTYPRTPAITDSQGKTILNSIAKLEKINIGGLDQWILMRGTTTENPVLLFLNGGPGFSEMGLFRHFNAELEKHFVVVNWDQRGAGKSYSKKLAREPMTIEKAIKELEEVGCPVNGIYKSGLSGTDIQRKWLMKFGGVVYGKSNPGNLVMRIMSTKEYSIIDRINFMKAMKMQSLNKLVEDEFLRINLYEQASEVKVPIYFFLGRHDNHIPSSVADRYFNAIIAPEKELIWFDQSAHSPGFEEAEKFNTLMIEKVLAETY